MRWRKLGHIFVAAGETEWMVSHAAVPFAYDLGDFLYRIYFSPRGLHNRSNISWLEIDIRRPTIILRMSNRPVLLPGSLGSFDESGVIAGWIHNVGSEVRLYYSGWQLTASGAFVNTIGMAARMKDGGDEFERVFHGPILGRSRFDPYFVNAPAVLAVNTGFRMWYLSGRSWDNEKAQLRARYNIGVADSPDGINWVPRSSPALDFWHPNEVAIARFSPIAETNGTCRAWYCYRGDDWDFRIGTATSANGFDWARQDESVGIWPDEAGWEKGSIAYPHVFDAEGGRYMLYCGGRYSAGGIGIAVLEDD